MGQWGEMGHITFIRLNTKQIIFVRCDRDNGLQFYLPSAIPVSVTDKNWNFSAVRRPIGLKLSGDLGLVSQISVHVLVSRFDYFLYCKQTKEQQNHRNRENRGFTNLAFSPLCRVRLI